jgi:hypothetical protein
MINRYCFFIGILISGIFLVQESRACRFNVRETGFVDLETERYMLVVYIDDQIPDKFVAEIRSLNWDLLNDSNIELELINVNKQQDHPAVEYVEVLQVTSYPAAVLLSPDGQSLVIPLGKPDQAFKQKLRKVFQDILTSSIRADLQKKVSHSYGVVLLIEGSESSENQAARKAIGEAISRVTRNLDLMPKPIKNPPVMTILKNNALNEELLLLWALGLTAASIDKPHAAIFYGKARWLGPLFKDKEITSNNLSEILLVIGADCECGLDKNWLRGTMLPLRWDKKDRAVIAGNLGFDPENPLIRMEIAQIMRSGYFTSGELHGSAGLDSVSGNRKGVTYATETSGAGVDNPPVNQSKTEETVLEHPLFISAAVLGFFVIAGLVIVLRRARLNKKSLQG